MHDKVEGHALGDISQGKYGETMYGCFCRHPWISGRKR